MIEREAGVGGGQELGGGQEDELGGGQQGAVGVLECTRQTGAPADEEHGLGAREPVADPPPRPRPPLNPEPKWHGHLGAAAVEGPAEYLFGLVDILQAHAHVGEVIDW